MKYEEALETLSELNKRGIHPGLEGIRKLTEALGSPEKGLKVIHVVGTNGKGSTALFISEIIKAAGYKCGLYSSPAVFDDREIIKVNGRMISKADYCGLVEEVCGANVFGCTRFEVETAMALKYFKDRECDFAVVEAGMGGLTDATNIVTDTVAAVIAPIGMDHTEYLGDTIEKIAAQKAGIIKKGCKVVSAVQVPEAASVIREKAAAEGASYCEADASFAEKVKLGLNKTTFTYKGMTALEINLLGNYQVKNTCLAVEAALALSLPEKAIRKGLTNARESGRFERICDKPLFYIDGAHNEPASLELRECIKTYFTKKKIIYIMGMLRDKDIKSVIRNTADLAECVFTVATPNAARTLSSFELAEAVREFNPMVTSLDSIEEAVEMAAMMALSDKNTVVLAFGSLSHLKRVRDAVSNIKNFKSDCHGAKR